ncbi:hypothetical protein MMC27_008862 [Xylographa pallens]|nr:hypothetical protein [Xylographa pallens]
MKDEESLSDEDTASTGYEFLLKKENEAKALRSSNVRSPGVLIYVAVCTAAAILFVLLVSTINAALSSQASKTDCEPPLEATPGSPDREKLMINQGRNPALRQEWRMLPFEARRSYIAAVRCLSNSPSRMGLNTTRYDDFVYSHLQMFNTTHNVPVSLPWHRYYIQQYENALRNECGYKGYLAYWDWTLDAADPESSPIWSDELGFSGNGSSSEQCVERGPLAHMAPQYPTPHCLRRNFAREGMHGRNYTAPIVEGLIAGARTYHEFRSGLELGPHRWIHRGIGGEMPTPWSTNGSCPLPPYFRMVTLTDRLSFKDPIFFVHHAQIDRLWWKWQHREPAARLRDYDSAAREPQEGLLKDTTTVSLEDPLRLYGLGMERKVGDVMSTETSLLCYKY